LVVVGLEEGEMDEEEEEETEEVESDGEEAERDEDWWLSERRAVAFLACFLVEALSVSLWLLLLLSCFDWLLGARDGEVRNVYKKRVRLTIFKISN
jgi:hypothetical protein